MTTPTDVRVTFANQLTIGSAENQLILAELRLLLQRNDDLLLKLNELVVQHQESTRIIMSQLTQVLSDINDVTNQMAAATDADVAAVQALRDQIAILIANGGPPTADELAQLDAIKTSLGATKAKLLAIAADPNNPVPTT